MTLSSSGDVSPTTITSPIATWRRSSLPISESPSMGLHRTSKVRRRTVAGFLVCLVLFLWVTSSSYRARRSQGIMSWRTAIQQAVAKHTGMAAAAAGSSSDGKQPKLIKLSMMYGESNEHYERALETQKKHSERWGHELRVLRGNASAGFWNKPTYMLSTIITELSKPRDERVEWVMWVDADTIVLNPAVPPEIFLPPRELPDVHMVATQDHNGLNTGIMFMRVHPWSVNMLTSAAAYPFYHPEADLGRNADQEAMRRILDWEDGGWENKGYRDSRVYVPRSWINAYQWDRGYEGDRGDFVVHFSGLEDEDRWDHMNDWLNILAKHQAEWEVSVEQTGHAANTTLYWEAVQKAKHAVGVMQAKWEGMKNDTAEEIVERERWANTTLGMQTALWEHSDDVDLLRNVTQTLVAGDL